MVPAPTPSSTPTVHACGHAARPPGRRIALAALLLLLQASSLSSACTSDDLEHTLHMTDGYGDGWNGATYTLTSDVDGTVAASGTMPDSGFTATTQLCLADQTCFVFTVGEGTYPSEIAWSIVDQGGQYVASGGGGTTVGLCVGSATPGPSLTLSPTGAVQVSTFAALSAQAQQDNVVIDITAAEILFEEPIIMAGRAGVTIQSSVGTILNGGGNTQLFNVKEADSSYNSELSDVTFTGINLHSGSSNMDGGCILVQSGSIVTMNNVGFFDCHAVRLTGRCQCVLRPTSHVNLNRCRRCRVPRAMHLVAN